MIIFNFNIIKLIFLFYVSFLVDSRRSLRKSHADCWNPRLTPFFIRTGHLAPSYNTASALQLLDVPYLGLLTSFYPPQTSEILSFFFRLGFQSLFMYVHIWLWSMYSSSVDLFDLQKINGTVKISVLRSRSS